MTLDGDHDISSLHSLTNEIKNIVVETFLFYMFKSEIFKIRIIEVNTNG